MVGIGSIFTNLIGNARGILDEVITTKEEKIDAAAKLDSILVNARNEIENEITERWKSDMNSDSWLAKNIRPLTLLITMTCTLLLVFIDSGKLEFEVKESWVDLLQLVLITIIGAYFGGRSVEKIKSTYIENDKKRKDKS